MLVGVDVALGGRAVLRRESVLCPANAETASASLEPRRRTLRRRFLHFGCLLEVM